MKIINAGYDVKRPYLDDPLCYMDILEEIEECGRTAMVSWDMTKEGSAERMVRRLIQDGHESVLEHVNMRVKFTVDRAFSHELVRQRLASFTQESQRFCNYSKDRFGNDITFVKPFYLRDLPKEATECWLQTMQKCEDSYFALLDAGAKPEEARCVLPNSTKTEVMMTANLREWRHILKLRAAGITGKPHPQMLEIMVPLLNELRMKLPVLFEDIKPWED